MSSIFTNILVPPYRWTHCPQVPKAVRINHPPPRREIQQLKAHGNDDPGNNQARPGCPSPLQPLVPVEAEPTPEQILYYTHDDVRRHVVGVVPAPETQVQDVHGVERHAEKRPGAQYALRARRLPVKPEYADRGVVHAVHDTRARGEVVELLREREVARVEEHAEDPAGEAEVAEGKVVLEERVRGRDALAQPLDAVVVREEVEERKDDAEGLLHAEEAVEGPLAVELVDWVHVGRFAGEALVGDDVLAGVVAF